MCFFQKQQEVAVSRTQMRFVTRLIYGRRTDISQAWWGCALEQNHIQSRLLVNTQRPQVCMALCGASVWAVQQDEERAASDSAIFYCLQIHVTCSTAEEPHLKGTEQSPDPAKRASANPSEASQASGRLWLPAPQ